VRPKRNFGVIYRSKNEPDQQLAFGERTVRGWKFQDPNWQKQQPEPDEDRWHEDDDSR